MVKFLYGSLIVYTVFYLLVFGFQSTLFPLILNQTADAFSLQFFNVMGIFPLWFIVDAWLHQQGKVNERIFLLGGLFLGAYAMIPLMEYLKKQPRKKAYALQLWLPIILLVVTIFVWFSFALANPLPYISNFFSDTLVGIMTVDFIVFYLYSLIRMQKEWTQIPYWAYIPLLGYACMLVFKAMIRVEQTSQ
jgi:hypothetical protein